MLKIAAVFMTTSVFAGLLISGPASVASTASATGLQFATVKVKTIAIHVGHSKRPVTPAAFSANAPGGTQLFAKPAIASSTGGVRRA